MRESIGMTVTINIMIVFILVAFVFIAGTVSYSRGFKSSSRVIKALEQYEGYNKLSVEQINNDLRTIGYNAGKDNCPATKKSGSQVGSLVTVDGSRYNYCVYLFDNDGDTKHYSYGVTVYITIDFTMFGIKIDLPMYAKTRRMYKFG